MSWTNTKASDKPRIGVPDLKGTDLMPTAFIHIARMAMILALMPMAFNTRSKSQSRDCCDSKIDAHGNIHASLTHTNL